MRLEWRRTVDARRVAATVVSFSQNHCRLRGLLLTRAEGEVIQTTKAQSEQGASQQIGDKIISASLIG